jgi:hypothetical protein
MNPTAAPELSPREKGFVSRIMRKYPGGQSTDRQLHRSLVIFSVMIVAAHLLERLIPSSPLHLAWWLPLAIVWPAGLILFSRYRRFSIFRSCVLSKVAGRLAQYEDLAPPSAHPKSPHSPAAAEAMSA